MKKPLISVIVPVYNAEKYLRECLMSIKNQTFENIEIICVNDGSTDKSMEIIREFAHSDPRFIVIDQKNQGVTNARMNGYKKAIGKYIAWVDNDDILELNMYNELLKLSEGATSDICICNYSLYPKENIRKKVSYTHFSGKNNWQFVAKNGGVLWNKITKREYLDKIEAEKLFLTMGEAAYSFILASTDKIKTTDQRLYNYRVGHDSVSSRYNKIKWFEITANNAKIAYEYSRQYNLPVEFQNYFYYAYLYYNVVLMAIAARNNKKIVYRNAGKIIKENKLFSRKFEVFLKNHLSFLRRIFFRICICSNYTTAKIISKVVLR